ncbi:hypothetical protein H7J74_16590 [Mycobacterium angelicum]|nr:hypothetical protein [Mycobacterium angelicum]
MNSDASPGTVDRMPRPGMFSVAGWGFLVKKGHVIAPIKSGGANASCGLNLQKV